MTPVAICDYSQGHGGFMLTAHLTFADGTVGVVFTDRTWQVRRLGAYVRPGFYDGRIPPDPFRPAAPVRNLWHTATSPLPPLTQTRLTPTPTGPLTVLPGQVREEVLSFDRIYAGYLSVAVKACGEIAMTVCCFETDEAGSREEFVFCGDQDYRGMRMHSALRSAHIPLLRTRNSTGCLMSVYIYSNIAGRASIWTARATVSRSPVRAIITLKH